MRLIDADALIETMEFHVTTMSVCSTTIEARAKGEMKRTCIADVANAPTIPSIPVEWMRDKMRGYASSLKSTETAALVMVMQMWQKEQEAQK